MRKTGCAVFSCKPSKWDSRHRFPDPDKKPELFKSWICAIGSKYLMDLPKIVVYEQHRLCKKHFRDDDFLNKRLKKNAFPGLCLLQGTYLLINFNISYYQQSFYMFFHNCFRIRCTLYNNICIYTGATSRS